MAPKFFAIGNPTRDIDIYNNSSLGGAVVYSAITAQKMGLETHIIGKFPADSPYVQELQEIGITVYNLPVRNSNYKDSITTFFNFYDRLGNRVQEVKDSQEEIIPEDLDSPSFPEIPGGSIVAVAPVLSEVNISLFPKLAKDNHLVVLPQGYFREVDYLNRGRIRRKSWGREDSLEAAEITILSDEDLSFNSHPDMTLLEAIKRACPIVILTEGRNGLDIFAKKTENGIKSNVETIRHIKPLELKDDEIKDFTGAGDTFAGAFISYYYTRSKNLREAATFGALMAALKIKGIGEKEGLRSIPDLSETENFIRENPLRYAKFVWGNGLDYLSIFPEGQNGFRERR